MRIEAGKTYKNGWGAKVKIVSAPTEKNRWFISDLGDGYHADGSLVQIDGTPKYNLTEVETPSGHAVTCQWHCDQFPHECTCGLIPPSDRHV